MRLLTSRNLRQGAAIAVALLWLYLASFGPACWMVDQGLIAAQPISRAFRPLLSFGPKTPITSIVRQFAETPDWTLTRLMDAANLPAPEGMKIPDSLPSSFTADAKFPSFKLGSIIESHVELQKSRENLRRRIASLPRARAQITEPLNRDETEALAALTDNHGEKGRPGVSAHVNPTNGFLDLHFHRDLCDDDVPLLRRISKLGSLRGVPLTDAQLQRLEGVGVRSLVCMDNFLINPTSLKGLPQLKELALPNSDITDAGLKHIGELRQLEELRFVRCSKITNAGFDHLQSRENLRRLFLNGNEGVTSAIFSGLARHRHLKSVTWINTRLNEDDLQFLHELPELESLHFMRTPVTDNGLDQIVRLPALKELGLVDSEVTDGGLERLSEANQLRSINLVNTKITDAGLVHLSGMTELTGLMLNQPEVGDEGIAHLSGLTSLTRLGLGGTAVSDKGVATLRCLDSLEELYLNDTSISDATLDRLSRCKKLVRLHVNGTAVSRAAVERLEQHLPNCHIISPYGLR